MADTTAKAAIVNGAFFCILEILARIASSLSYYHNIEADWIFKLYLAVPMGLHFLMFVLSFVFVFYLLGTKKEMNSGLKAWGAGLNALHIFLFFCTLAIQ